MYSYYSLWTQLIKLNAVFQNCSLHWIEQHTAEGSTLSSGVFTPNWKVLLYIYIITGLCWTEFSDWSFLSKIDFSQVIFIPGWALNPADTEYIFFHAVFECGISSTEKNHKVKNIFKYSIRDLYPANSASFYKGDKIVLQSSTLSILCIRMINKYECRFLT